MSDLLNSLYHNCRSCHWFSHGKCQHDSTFTVETDLISQVQNLSEEGLIHEAIEESFSEGDFSEVKAALSETRLSKKKINEIMTILHNEVEANQADWADEIDRALFTAIEGTAFNDVDLVPEDPDSFYCNYFE